MRRSGLQAEGRAVQSNNTEGGSMTSGRWWWFCEARAVILHLAVYSHNHKIAFIKVTWLLKRQIPCPFQQFDEIRIFRGGGWASVKF